MTYEVDSIFVTNIRIWLKTYLNLSYKTDDKLFRSLMNRVETISLVNALPKIQTKPTIFLIEQSFLFLRLPHFFYILFFCCSESYEKIRRFNRNEHSEKMHINCCEFNK